MELLFVVDDIGLVCMIKSSNRGKDKKMTLI